MQIVNSNNIAIQGVLKKLKSLSTSRMKFVVNIDCLGALYDVE